MPKGLNPTNVKRSPSGAMTPEHSRKRAKTGELRGKQVQQQAPARNSNILKPPKSVNVRFDNSLSDRTAALLPQTPSVSEGHHAPAPSRAPVMALCGIRLDESLGQAEAEQIIADFGNQSSFLLDPGSEETLRLLSALNKTGQRLTLDSGQYSEVLRDFPELVWGRFVISESDVLSEPGSSAVPKLYQEHGTHPSSIMAGLLEIMTGQEGITQQCLAERQSYHDLLVLASVLVGHYAKQLALIDGGFLDEKDAKFKSFEEKIKPLLVGTKFSENALINSQFRKETLEEYRTMAMDIDPVLTEGGLAISHYFNNPIHCIPELAKLGQRVINTYQQQAEQVGLMDAQFPHHYFDDEFEYKTIDDRSTPAASEQDQALYSKEQQRGLVARANGTYYPHPVKNPDGSTKMDAWVKEHKLFQSLAMATSKDGKVTPQFLGFVDPRRANGIVLKRGSFRDHAISDNILHTKNVHDVQARLLRDKGLFDDEFLTRMLSGPPSLLSMWEALLDQNCLSPLADSYLGDQIIQHPCLSLGAPSRLFPLLSSQQISKALQLFADQASPDMLKQLLHTVQPDFQTGTEEAMRDALRTLSLQINAVEVSMISSNYKDLVKAGELTAPAFEERFEKEGKGFEESHPALKAIEMYNKVTSLADCNFIADPEMEGLGRKAYEPQVLRDKNGNMMENEDGSCYLLPDGHMVSKDFAILYKVRSAT